MLRLLILMLITLSFQASADFDISSIAPAKILGKYPDKDSPTGISWVIANGDGISVVRVPKSNAKDIISSLWGDCRAVLPVRDLSTFVDSDFCKATRSPEFDQPNKGLIAFTFNDPQTASKNYRKAAIWSLLTLFPGKLFASSNATTTFLIPSNEDDLENQDLIVELRFYRGTILNPDLKVLRLKAVR